MADAIPELIKQPASMMDVAYQGIVDCTRSFATVAAQNWIATPVVMQEAKSEAFRGAL